MEAVSRLAGGKKVVGWFRFRRGVPLLMTAREQTVHDSLRANLYPKAVFAALTHAAEEPAFHIHSFDYKIFQMVGDSLAALSIAITNMQQSAEQEYQAFRCPTPHSSQPADPRLAFTTPQPFDSIIPRVADSNGTQMARLSRDLQDGRLDQIALLEKVIAESLEAMKGKATSLHESRTSE